jgi:superfamily II DNA or RNA helicase
MPVVNSYLGSYGYTIFKNELTEEETEQMKKDLTVKPFSMTSTIGAAAKSFPIYRECDTKYFVPHYYGIEKYGLPKQYKLSEGEPIHVPFAGVLREHQIDAINTFIGHCEKVQYGGGLLELPCAWGKTAGSLYIASKLCKKTIVIVNKNFLANQWIERIQQFMPTARVGRIQGQTVDIEDKDIVICMLQSLCQKSYPASTFKSFGFMIIDEVHHISSETFSNALFKIVTKFTLGLSATMNRKDGTTYVFKMFLGDVIFKEKRRDELNVVVKGILYSVNDEEFNETKYDFRGNPAYSTMISKLCTYNRRSEFIVNVVQSMFEHNKNQQIMILAHNRNLLTYLHDAIKHRNIATVGYYVGGMKESALKETESKQVVIATYSMAAEALDIKTLTTLIMATPKTDIEQSVGRILREKHSKPVVVDIIDTHDLFQRQWMKRKRFYKRENYKIIYTEHNIYNSNINDKCWRVLYKPKQTDDSSSSENEDCIDENNNGEDDDDDNDVNDDVADVNSNEESNREPADKITLNGLSLKKTKNTKKSLFGQGVCLIKFKK